MTGGLESVGGKNGLAASLRLRSPFSVSSAPLPAKPGLSAKSGFFWAAAGAMESAVASSSAVTA